MTEPTPLAASLCLDQRERWQRGESVLVETYVERFPALHTNPDSLLDLIYNEIVLREESGEQPQLEEYLGRFGQFEPQLRQLFEVHQALEKAPDEAAESLHQFTRTLLDDAVAPPGYAILGELGRGGMGVVYRARQTSLGRIVALKMILASEHAGPQRASRFRAEAEAVARFQHPNIVQVFEVGEHDRRPYFSMELVEGGTLAARIAGNPQPAAEAAHLVEVLARAVQHAHSRGVVHRDLKPANVLLLCIGRSATGTDSSAREPINREGPLTGVVPKITDFGLAKRLDLPAAQTQTGAVMGSPSYMAPEQTGRGQREVGPAADVWALGAILYELLTGRPPFKAETPLDTLLQVVHDDPLPPSRLRARTPRDLETVCLKCLEKDPRRRYPSAEALADDLRRFLDGKPVLARPLSPVGRTYRWARRRPTVAALIAVSVLVLAGLAALGAWHRAREDDRLARARADVEQTLEDARDDFRQEQWELAGAHLRNALARIDAEPSLAQWRPGAEHLLAETEACAFAADAWGRFTRSRDEALFHRLELLSLGDLADSAALLPQVESAAREALAAIGLDPDGDRPWEPDRRFGDLRRARLMTDGATLLLVLAEVHADRRRYADALRVLDRAGQVGPREQALVERRAAYLRGLGDEAGAHREEQAGADLKPATAWGYFLLGDEAYRRGDRAGAIRAFEAAVGLSPEDFWSELLLARCYADRKEWDRAKACLTVSIVVRPDVVWARLLRGYVHREMGVLVAADADFAKAEELLAGGADGAARFSLCLNRGLLRLRQGRHDEGVADLEAAARLQPDDWSPHLNLARAYEQAGSKDEAEGELRLVLARRPPPLVLSDYHAARARDLYEARRDEEAVAECRSALKEYDLALAHGYQGLALLRLSRHQEAAREFSRYLETGGPPLNDVFRGRGQARMKLGDYLGASDDYTRVVLAQPDAEIYEFRGWAYFFADAWRPALRDFDESLRLDPERGDAYAGRALAHVMLGRVNDAVADADEALKRKPSEPEMMHNLACVFAQAAARGSPRDAASYRERAVGCVRQTLALVPEKNRTAFLRDSVLPDTALDPIRKEPAFRQLLKEHRLGS
jgi:serine/threonine protein kinase/Flp pilus assembly protein TadD